MKLNRIARLIALAAMATTTGYQQTAFAQTAGELMQKGIYTQETAGDLDGAIAIYRQIVNSGSSPRDLAAQAQYRLAQSLLQKGDLGNAATEFSNLARNYADYGRLVSSMATMARTNLAVAGGGRGGRGGALDQNAMELANAQARLAEVAAVASQTRDPARMAELDRLKANVQAQLAELEARRRQLEENAVVPNTTASVFDGISFNGGSPVTVKGAVIESLLINPTAAILVDPQDGSGKKYAFATSSPRQMSLQGWVRQTVKAGDQVTVNGVLSKDGRMLSPGIVAASATTITAGDGRKLFDRAVVQK